jgi:hypothetical protein
LPRGAGTAQIIGGFGSVGTQQRCVTRKVVGPVPSNASLTLEAKRPPHARQKAGVLGKVGGLDLVRP